MSLKDVLLPEPLPVLVREKTGSKEVVEFDLIATRIVPVEDHFVLSDSVYLIPRRPGLELIGKLRKHLNTNISNLNLESEFILSLTTTIDQNGCVVGILTVESNSR